MSEIIKLYDNAGIAPKKCSECDNNMDCGFGRGCYPPFTAEKQIELLEFMYKYERVLDVGYIIEKKKFDVMHYEYGSFDTLQEALCADVNYHWKWFTEEEKQQVKGILE